MRFFAFIFLFYFCLILVAYGGINPQADAMVKQGNLLLQAGKYEEAEKKFEQAYRMQSDNMDALFFWAFTNYKLGKLREAEEKYKRIIGYIPDYPEAHYYLALVYNAENKPAQAIEELERSIQYDPKFVKGYYTLGVIYYQQKNLTKAIEIWKKGFSQNCNEHSLLSSISQAYYNRGVLTEAENWQKKALTIAGKNPEYRFNLGWIYWRENKITEAIKELENCRKLSKPTTTINIEANITLALIKGNGLKEALLLADKIDEKERDALWFYLKGALIEKLGNREEATNYYKQALEIDPNFIDASEALHKKSN